MTILWKYLKPWKWFIIVILGFAEVREVLNRVDPIIFGKIIDDYALHPGDDQKEKMVNA